MKHSRNTVMKIRAFNNKKHLIYYFLNNLYFSMNSSYKQQIMFFLNNFYFALFPKKLYSYFFRGMIFLLI